MLAPPAFRAGDSVAYRFSIPEPQHHWMQVEASFTDLGAAPLELRMSRSSPGRYSLHDFAKNVYDVHASDADGRELAIDAARSVRLDGADARRRRDRAATRCSAIASTARTSPSTPRTST